MKPNCNSRRTADIAVYMDDLPDEALLRVVGAPFERWKQQNMLDVDTGQRCLVGHVADYIPAPELRALRVARHPELQNIGIALDFDNMCNLMGARVAVERVRTMAQDALRRRDPVYRSMEIIL